MNLGIILNTMDGGIRIPKDFRQQILTQICVAAIRTLFKDKSYLWIKSWMIEHGADIHYNDLTKTDFGFNELIRF